MYVRDAGGEALSHHGLVEIRVDHGEHLIIGPCAFRSESRISTDRGGRGEDKSVLPIPNRHVLSLPDPRPDAIDREVAGAP